MVPSRTVEGIVLLDLPGALETDALKTQVQALAEKKQDKVALNLSQLTFIESLYLGELVAAHRLCEEQGATLVMYGIQPYVQKLMEVTKLNRILKLYKTEAEALAALKN